MLTLNLNEHGTGTIEYGPEDVNYVDWEINSARALVFTETDGSGDSWNWAVANTLGEGRGLISVLSPGGQADVGNDVMEAVLTENSQPAVKAQKNHGTRAKIKTALVVSAVFIVSPDRKLHA